MNNIQNRLENVLLSKIKGNKTSVFFIIFMFIMIILIAAIMMNTITTTTNPVYGQQDKTSFNETYSSNIQSISVKNSRRGHWHCIQYVR